MQRKHTARDFDFEKYEPSFWALNARWMAPLAVFVLTVVLTVLSFPPFRAMAFAYVFAAPLCFWALTKPRFKTYALVMLGAQAVAWTIILWWLHHVTWAGVFLLGPFVGAWIGVWYLAVWWAARNFAGRPFLVRAAVMLGLAGLWVVIEWTRVWFLSGFPWLPLGASQWYVLSLWQVASYTGQGGIAFVLIVFNFAVASYTHRIFKEKHSGLRKRSPEFSMALIMLLLVVTPSLTDVLMTRRTESVAVFKLVQPDIPAAIKWSKENEELSYRELRRLSLETKPKTPHPEVIVWPEAAPPYAVFGWPSSAELREWLVDVSEKARAPLLTGAITADDPARPDETFYNAAFVVDAGRGGVQPEGYKKRHLVPFGEYVPLRPLLGWLEKVTDASSGDTQAGASAKPLYIHTPRRIIAAGMLVCYEDIFPSLAVNNVISGADVHVVVTNNGWFGQGGAAYQHAAHSMLRAVETRRPVIRCGNSGWSGWIDEYGGMRGMMKNKDDSIYFRGTGTFVVERDTRWVGTESFYVRYGDWFVAVSGALAFFGYMMTRFFHPRDKAPIAYTEAGR
ncbi:apolipoprotein N-acyltransferase [Ereboglobus luteus]|uniref:Apolipoprotein N-acyltransferase n=1 Tax=Ereboglobus luteus TaxID=1796921 RepID=A0A2U8E491_9BACT|nr:apolipoprotein N-acyltransferase [Ereboglobus luteus]AWI09364.1 apolipoprotein N-acyltransferase [Ereboglobus luteus]